MSNELTPEQSKDILARQELLPIGTVVLLEKANRKIMIIGVLQIDGQNQSVLYDYSGVVYPEGLINPKNNYLFNANQIERIFYMGYHNEEQDNLQKTVKIARENFYARNGVNNYKKGKKNESES